MVLDGPILQAPFLDICATIMGRLELIYKEARLLMMSRGDFYRDKTWPRQHDLDVERKLLCVMHDKHVTQNKWCAQ